MRKFLHELSQMNPGIVHEDQDLGLSHHFANVLDGLVEERSRGHRIDSVDNPVIDDALFGGCHQQRDVAVHFGIIDFDSMSRVQSPDVLLETIRPRRQTSQSKRPGTGETRHVPSGKR